MKNQNILRYTKLYIIWVLISLFNFSIVNAALIDRGTNTRLQVKKTLQGTYELLLDNVFKGTIDPNKIKLALKNLEIYSFNPRDALQGDKAYFDLGSIVSSTIDLGIIIQLFQLDSVIAQPTGFLGMAATRFILSLYKYYKINKHLKSLDASKTQNDVSANIALLSAAQPILGAVYEIFDRDNESKHLLDSNKVYPVNNTIFKIYLDRLLKYSTSEETPSVIFPKPTEPQRFNLNDTGEDDLHS